MKKLLRTRSRFKIPRVLPEEIHERNQSCQRPADAVTQARTSRTTVP